MQEWFLGVEKCLDKTWNACVFVIESPRGSSLVPRPLPQVGKGEGSGDGTSGGGVLSARLGLLAARSPSAFNHEDAQAFHVLYLDNGHIVLSNGWGVL